MSRYKVVMVFNTKNYSEERFREYNKGYKYLEKIVEDTKNYPDISQYAEDEYESFVVNLETQQFYPARDFFYMVDVKEFEAID